MHIAVEGCSHGELDIIYAAVEDCQHKYSEFYNLFYGKSGIF